MIKEYPLSEGNEKTLSGSGEWYFIRGLYGRIDTLSGSKLLTREKWYSVKKKEKFLEKKDVWNTAYFSNNNKKKKLKLIDNVKSKTYTDKW